MALKGPLSDLPLPELIQLLAANRASGKLTVSRREGYGVVVFRDGRILYAATNAAREAIGNLLLMQRHVTATELAAAIEVQARSREDRRLGSILVEMGAVSPDKIAEVVRQQVEDVLRELFAWPDGFVRFEPMEVALHGEVLVDARDFLVREGLVTNRVVFAALAARVEETGTEGELRPPQTSSPTLAVTLKEILASFRTARFTGEVTLSILRFGARFLERGVLLLVRSGELCGIGQYGVANVEPDRVRRLRLDATATSAFRQALARPIGGPSARRRRRGPSSLPSAARRPTRRASSR